MHCVEKKNLSASFEDIAIFHVNLEIDKIVSSEKFVKNACNMGISSQPPLKIFFFNTVHNLIVFSIVFTNFFFFFSLKFFMNLYSKTFYILNFSRKKNCMVKYTQN